MQSLSSNNNKLLEHISELFDGQCHQKLGDYDALLVSDEAKQHFKNYALISGALRYELCGKVDLNFAEKVMSKIKAENKECSAISINEKSAHDSEHERNDLPSALQNWINVKQSKEDSRLSNNAADAQVLDVAYNITDRDYAKSSLSKEEINLDNGYASDNAQHANSKNVTRSSGNILHLPPRVKFFKRVGIFATQIGIAAGVAVVAVIATQTYNASDTQTQPVINQAPFSSGPVSGLNLASYQTANSDYIVPVGTNNQYDEFEGPVKMGQETAQYSQKQDFERVNSYLQGYVNNHNDK